MEHQISCMSFNLLSRNTGGTTFAEASVRFPYAVKTIFKYNPDILGVQEAEGWVKTAQLDWYIEMSKVLTTLGNYEYCAIIDDKDCKLERQTIGAGLMIATIPTVLIYLLLSEQVQNSLVAGAVKG